jgi:molecular chaperone GrpE
MSEQQSNPAAAGPAQASAEPAAVTTGSTLEAALAEAREAAEKAKDQALRAAAEAENVRRRAQRDVESAHKFALERFAADLLPVVDSLERAVATAQAGTSSGNAAAIAEGVALSLKLFVDTLGKSGIVRVDPLGQPFDPKVHQAVSMVESATAEPGSVVQVLQPGFTLHGRVVRPAMVMVAKAAAAPDPAGAA